MGGITGQSSSSRTNSTILGEGATQIAGSNSGNTVDNSQVNTLTADNGAFTAGGDITVNQTDPGILDLAGSIFGDAAAVLGRTSETALSLIQRVVESGFGAANRATDIVSQSSAHALDQVATAEGKATLGTFDRYGIWIIGIGAALVAAWFFTRKGK